MTALEEQLGHLIDAGWKVIDSDFDLAAFCQWRREAMACIDALTEHDNTADGGVVERWNAFLRENGGTRHGGDESRV